MVMNFVRPDLGNFFEVRIRIKFFLSVGSGLFPRGSDPQPGRLHPDPEPCPNSMAMILILDGKSEIGAHARSNHFI